MPVSLLGKERIIPFKETILGQTFATRQLVAQSVGSAWGQECWQLIAQWVWNLRLELGHHLHPDPVRTTEFAPALPPPQPRTAPAAGYTPPEMGSTWKAGRFSGDDFAIQPDGTLRCPANQELRVQEQRREVDGSLRVVYAASIRNCRPCPRREQC
jgi:hypothetical protein